MKHFLVSLAVFAGLALFLTGCKGDVGPAGPSLSGALTGRVFLYAENGSKMSNHESVSVWIEGSADTTLTDSLGKWRIDGVRTGIYSIMIRKAGYGFTKLVPVQFVGGGELFLGLKTLVKDPSFTTEAPGFGWTFATSMGSVWGSVSNTAPTERPILVYVGRGPIDPLDPSTYINTVPGTILANSNAYNSQQMALSAPPYNFAQGDTMYFTVFAQSSITDGYTDPETGEAVISTGRPQTGGSSTFRRP